MRFITWLSLFTFLLTACLPQPNVAPAILTPPVVHNRDTYTPSSLPLFTSSPSLAPTELQITQFPPTDTPISTDNAPTDQPINQSTNPLFPLTLPISLTFPTSIPIDPSYRFASTQGGQREPHHGLEFLLPFGSPVLAAADGTVLFAGNDNNGSPYSPPNNYAFYGNFIIIEHPNTQSTNQPITNQPLTSLYTLYAHLSQINVQTGTPVRAGDEIGLIGFTGAALGPHLHFEVRLNGLTYADSHNPELYLNQPGNGILAGRILDANGHRIPPTALTIIPLPMPLTISNSQLTINNSSPLYLTTYEDPALALRPPFNENFALALPPGPYELAFVLYGVHKQVIEIRPSELTFFEMTVGNE